MKPEDWDRLHKVVSNELDKALQPLKTRLAAIEAGVDVLDDRIPPEVKQLLMPKGGPTLGDEIDLLRKAARLLLEKAGATPQQIKAVGV